MTTPISNDKILPSDGGRTLATEKRAAGNPGTVEPGSDSSAAVSQDAANTGEMSSIDVERANQVYSQEQTQITSKEKSVANQEQARNLASDVGKQIEANALQALKAQAGSVSMNITALLETAPA